MSPHIMIGLPLVTGIAMLALTWYVRRHRSAHGAPALAWSQFCIAAWCLTHAFEHLCDTLEGHLFWGTVQFPAIAFIPVCFVVVTLRYTGRPCSRRTVWVLSIAAAVASLIRFSDPWTHFYYSSTWIQPVGSIHTLGRVYGPVFPYISGYFYLLLTIGVVQLLVHARAVTGLARKRTLVFVGAALIPFLLNVAYVLDFTPLRHYDVTTFAFAITGVSMTLAVFRYRFQAVAPVAWRTVVESMQDGAIVVDAEGFIEDLNASGCAFLGVAAHHVTGRPAEEVFCGHPHLAAVARGDRDADTLIVQTDTGERTWELRGTPVRGPRRRKETVGRLLTLHDTTDQTALVRELRESREAAEQAAVAKSRFLATMSHEIRTPMNGVMGMSDILLGMGLTEEQHECVLTILESSRNLLRILDEVLDYSKIDAGRLELENVAFSLPDQLERMRRLMEPMARKRGLCLELTGPDAAVNVMGDPGRLRQILTNLVGNGLKFTAHGGVTIRWDAQPNGDSRVDLTISVQDTGTGIDADRLDRLFREFSQCDASTSRLYGGTGLGLAICRRLAEAMGGSISVESTPGRGSRFTLRVALNCAAAPELELLPAAGAQPRPGCRILLAEDNQINQLVATRMLQRLGCAVEIAGNGHEAVRLAHDHNYDLILMDCEMPELDGLMATTKLRHAGIRTPVVAMTASVMDDTRRACREVGMNDFLSKPIASERLAELVVRWTTDQHLHTATA